MKGGEGIIAVTVDGESDKRGDISQKKRKTRKVQQKCDKADQPGVAAEQQQKPARTHVKPFDGEREVQR